MNYYTIATLSERWRDISKHNKCVQCGKHLEPGERVAIANIDCDYASPWCLDCAIADLKSDIENLKGVMKKIDAIREEVRKQ